MELNEIIEIIYFKYLWVSIIAFVSAIIVSAGVMRHRRLNELD